MDKPLSHHTTFYYLFLLSSLSLSSASYTVPQHYFINCGSPSSVKLYGLRTFVGDSNSGMIAAGKTTPVQDSTSSNSTELYRTARIFRNPSSYELDIPQTGTYVVRFHFFPFSALGNLSAARFSVEASGFRILSNFSIGNISSSDFPIIEEFSITIDVGKFMIRFLPTGFTSFAFVNAIEAFIAPPGSVSDSALHVIHRVNVGGEDILPNSDKLFRNWISDDGYVMNKEIAKKRNPYTGNIYYQSTDYQEFIAPTSVYNTAKETSISNRSNGVNSSSKIEWRFDVKRGAKHLVRLHFCDIVSTTTNEFLRFNLFVNGDFTVVYPYEHVSRTAAAFYVDVEVDSDGSGVVDVSIGPRNDSRPSIAFLNGLEILEVVTESGSELGRKRSRRGGLFTVIGSSVGSVLVFICFTVYWFGLRKKKLKLASQFNHPASPPHCVGSTTSGTRINLGLKMSLSEILHATRNFDTKLVIGAGGFGKVYKGTLRDGTNIAVKRSEAGLDQGLPEFETEITVLSAIRHRHLVSLIGYCDENDEMILVYEFMEKGTLRGHLYDKGKSKSELSWEQRLGMCIDAAKGIHYLHTGSSGAIIHRDIKSTNILLDQDYVAKVADFGLSKPGPIDDQTHVSTAVKGSFGYLDPDYFRCLKLTQKSDVYSFGVVLLEVISGRAVIARELPREQVSLSEWGLSLQRKGQLDQILDPFLVGRINPNSLRKFGEIVEKCLEEYGADRANMVDVLWDLEYCLQLQNAAVCEASYDDSTITDIAMAVQMDVLQRLPSQRLSMEDEDDQSSSFSDSVARM